ncbi:SRPBCC family protein [Nonomuraea cavernae]|uniref:Carbon monoxide dehydrogenase subunit G n=1 Tax=Nonomuraea cavernae TaxID=2045107 RepID=A0A917Z6K6_9ACTN|nr:SRPBCC family protein [Nonomuraea cavernae]MCA2188695.1 SRPBCC family protein [Nonomuraea cavernae]GGO74261.1 carbon monoxide dehydrogenase subunit G [Nonomuraea cavernae]
MAMRFEHDFTVPVPIEQAWAVLLDVERVAPCLPGAALDTVEGDEFTGRMKIKVGPITVTYRGSARFEDVDKDAHTLTIQASGKESRGTGTAAATVKATLSPADGSTAVAVESSFNVTGRPAQFGRGVMAEVGGKLIDRFAANLADLLAEPAHEFPAAPAVPVPAEGAAEVPEEGPAEGPVEGPAVVEERHLSAVPSPPDQDIRPAGTLRTSRTPDEEALDLLEIAGTPLLKRLAPVAGAVAALLLIGWLIRRLMR